MNPERSAPRGLHGHLVHELGRDIAHGRLAAGDQIVPEDVGERHGVSRTVVREALRVLESKGMVVARPKTGTRVRPVEEWDLLDRDVILWRAQSSHWRSQLADLLDMRAAIEPLAARGCARRATPEDIVHLLAHCATMDKAVSSRDWPAFHKADRAFHGKLLAASGNLALRRLSGAIDAVLEVRSTLELEPESIEPDVVTAHYAIVEAISHRDPTQAETASRTLIDTAEHEIDQALEHARQTRTKRPRTRVV
ncbi:FadR/GntR family transcriptional regulator [Kitasatospora sp. NPDC057015]|uniref:FadR/GntR family transcriptional regulator n=1 Tax=Kitasatospora sp. NPDC057015 TaxID=3346001 RepID=UPI00362A9805